MTGCFASSLVPFVIFFNQTLSIRSGYIGESGVKKMLLNHNGLDVCQEGFASEQAQDAQACWSPAVVFAV